MPGRQSHGGAPSKTPKVRVSKSKKRALDAFSIASHENPDRIKIRQSRLGASEGGNRPGKKRARDENDEDEDDEEDSHAKKPRKGPAKGRFDELDVDEGSDSDGNNWKLGQVDSDDDSDLDSDEAFGESDEERFDGFTFGGSSNKKVKKRTPKPKDVDLDEDDEESGSELSDNSLGEDAIDLATMLDQTEGVSEDEQPSQPMEQRAKKSKHGQEDSENDTKEQRLTASDSDGEDDQNSGMELDAEDSGSEEDSEDSEHSEDDSSMSSADDEETDPINIAAMYDMINSLPQATELKRSERHRNDGGTEFKVPLSTAPGSRKKLLLEDFTQSKSSESKKRPPKALEVPIAKRQQDRLDRTAAYDKTKETLGRWTDTVKHNRRAEHLVFPLPDSDVASAHANTRLAPTAQAKPFNELEATIQSILEESGLAAANGKDEEDHLREFEELETNKMSVEEVKARRDHLRMARELLFREEAKAKRVKKIKSKSYRKVHRKQREKEEKQNKEALAEGGFVPSEDELEAQDRRRAEERMGAKHRGSKWAKATKETGRAAWDEDARAGVTEMARRDEELRKRVEGRSVREFDGGSSISSSESDELSDDDEGRLRRLDQFGDDGQIDESAPGGKLANMKFMLKAEASRKKENDALVEEMRKEMAGGESTSEAEVGDVGRRMFGAANNKPNANHSRAKLDEFEEPAGSEDDGNDSEIEFQGFDNVTKGSAPARRKNKTDRPSRSLQLSKPKPKQDVSPEGGAWSKVTSKSNMITDAEGRKRRQKKNNAVDVEELDLSKAAVIAAQPRFQKVAKKSTTTLEVESEDDSDGENAVRLPFAIRDQELIKRAFAGADVVGEFEAEKKQTIEDEDEKVVDNTLPGWGSWTGDGLSKKEKAKNKGRVLTKVEGRKDAKLERVIMNEKRVKKNGKYLASSLPHPFESRQQYERSLRLPVGPEWATKETFQDATKPRVLLRQGIVAPMSKPLL